MPTDYSPIQNGTFDAFISAEGVQQQLIGEMREGFMF
jgi:hypothetical protein